MAATSTSTSYIAHVDFPTQCSFPPRAGNSVIPLIDGVEAFSRVFDVILFVCLSFH